MILNKFLSTLNRSLFLWTFARLESYIRNGTEVQLTLDNSNPHKLKVISVSFQAIFYITLPSITPTSDNSNLFLFPLKVRVIEN